MHNEDRGILTMGRPGCSPRPTAQNSPPG